MKIVTQDFFFCIELLQCILSSWNNICGYQPSVAVIKVFKSKIFKLNVAGQEWQAWQNVIR